MRKPPIEKRLANRKAFSLFPNLQRLTCPRPRRSRRTASPFSASLLSSYGLCDACLSCRSPLLVCLLGTFRHAPLLLDVRLLDRLVLDAEHVDAALLAYLRLLKATQAKDEMRLGEAYQITDEDKAHDRAVVILPKKLPPTDTLERRMLLCIKANGTPILDDSFKRLLRQHGINSHSLRHTHTTKLIEAGAKPVAVVVHLSHKDATITQNLYTHDTEATQKETARIFGEIVGKL